MLYKCDFSLLDEEYKDRKFEGVLEIIQKKDINLYYSNSPNNDNQIFRSALHKHKNTHTSIWVETEYANYVIHDCYINSPMVGTLDTNTNSEYVYSTFNGEMVRISCHSWIDFPFSALNIKRSYEELVLKDRAIELDNLNDWNTIGNNGLYDYQIDLPGISFELKRWKYHAQYHAESKEYDVANIGCSFRNNTQYNLTELAFLLASFRDFLTFTTGRFVKIQNINSQMTLSDDSPYSILFNAGLDYYYPCIEETTAWSINNIPVNTINKIGLSKLFNIWHEYYSKNSFSLSFFGRVNRKTAKPQEYLISALIAFDSISEESTPKSDSIINLRNNIYKEHEVDFKKLGIKKEKIILGEIKTSLKNRLMNAMLQTKSHFVDTSGKLIDDNTVAKDLAEIRNAASHGRKTRHNMVLQSHEYFLLGSFMEKLLIEYVKHKVFGNFVSNG